MDAGFEGALSAEEMGILHTITERGSAAEVRRARIVLGWAEGLAAEAIAVSTGLTAPTVVKWIGEFQAKRLAIFPDHLIGSLSPGAQPNGEEPSIQTPVQLSIEQLCRNYDVDMNHAVHVGQLARNLLEVTRPLHTLDARFNDLIYVAGLLHNVALAGGSKAHHTRGRDILLSTPLTDLNDADRALLAATTAFHRKPWSAKRLQSEPSYTALDQATQSTARWLSAVLRIADGLDYAGSQATRITATAVDLEGCEIIVAGPQVDIDAARADEKADMWRAVVGIPLTVITRQEAKKRAHRPHVTTRPTGLRISPEEQMHEAGRTILHFHLQRMIYHDPGTRQGEDIEALHDMRVATRRMRAALRLFGPYFDGPTRKWVQNGLQKTGTMLGAVRDWDVLLDHVHTFQATQSEDQRAGLEALIDYWQKKRSRTKRQMLDYLDSDEYVSFVRRFLKFCKTQGAGKASSALVAHAAPVLIYRRYETVRAYEPGITEAPLPTLHALRIDIKRFRYTLEFFETALGPQAREVLDSLVAAQNHFGALQDADTAAPLITEAMKKLRRGASEAELDAVRVYLDDRRAEIERLKVGAPEMLASITTPEMRQKLALTVSTL